MTTAPKFNRQGNIIAERDDVDGGFWVLFPDGQVEHADTEAQVERRARTWFKKNRNDAAAINIGTITWQEIPA